MRSPWTQGGSDPHDRCPCERREKGTRGSRAGPWATGAGTRVTGLRATSTEGWQQHRGQEEAEGLSPRQALQRPHFRLPALACERVDFSWLSRPVGGLRHSRPRTLVRPRTLIHPRTLVCPQRLTRPPWDPLRAHPPPPQLCPIQPLSRSRGPPILSEFIWGG